MARKRIDKSDLLLYSIVIISAIISISISDIIIHLIAPDLNIFLRILFDVLCLGALLTTIMKLVGMIFYFIITIVLKIKGEL